MTWKQPGSLTICDGRLSMTLYRCLKLQSADRALMAHLVLNRPEALSFLMKIFTWLYLKTFRLCLSIPRSSLDMSGILQATIFLICRCWTLGLIMTRSDQHIFFRCTPSQESL